LCDHIEILFSGYVELLLNVTFEIVTTPQEKAHVHHVPSVESKVTSEPERFFSRVCFSDEATFYFQGN